MAQRINLFDAIGKTISNVAIGNCDQTCLILFDDDTFATIDCYSEISLDEEFEPLDFGDPVLVDLGLYSPADIKAMRDERDSRFAALREQGERTQLQRLLQKYGTPQP